MVDTAEYTALPTHTQMAAQVIMTMSLTSCRNNRAGVVAYGIHRDLMRSIRPRLPVASLARGRRTTNDAPPPSASPISAGLALLRA